MLTEREKLLQDLDEAILTMKCAFIGGAIVWGAAEEAASQSGPRAVADLGPDIKLAIYCGVIALSIIAGIWAIRRYLRARRAWKAYKAAGNA